MSLRRLLQGSTSFGRATPSPLRITTTTIHCCPLSSRAAAPPQPANSTLPPKPAGSWTPPPTSPHVKLPAKKPDGLVLPRRHSRHAVPKACVDATQRAELTEEILTSSPGSLFTYEPKNEEGNDGSANSMHWKVADDTIQKIEFLMRGYAAGVQGTIQQRGMEEDESQHELLSEEVDPQEAVEQQKALLDRIMEEGEMYMELRDRMRSQLQVEKERLEAEEAADQKKNVRNKPPIQIPLPKAVPKGIVVPGAPENQPREKFASPGPTIGMMDTLLDTLVFWAGPNTPQISFQVLKTAAERFHDDGSYRYNTNIHTIPTPVTWNAPLRAVSRMDVSSEKVRDEMLEHSLGFYDEMVHNQFPRNAATFIYMLRIVDKLLPSGQTKGNVSFGFFHHALEEKVLSVEVCDEMRKVHTPSNGDKFDKAMQAQGMLDHANMNKKYKARDRRRRYDKDSVIY
uniref:Uncharacterized protein n=1 Tax=Grammatophora oceanica TaxID=210454 RepID=A0A7S1UWN4_9STRA|mmetsp:Transcript_27401/g.40173  ORF Transcript_27401/g.40173 Transcript_27401/m.40173 type:complete len:455 (+) Transcript_27401:131-1495(+)